MIKQSAHKLTAQVGKATAYRYADSRRVIVIADEDSFDDARKALDELRDAVS